ncbi:hypothetical protein JKY79_03180, partial [Candidatus Babeliales bacterium]|nr:hypothetical protein [Candidatus Babeliales bacterium]
MRKESKERSSSWLQYLENEQQQQRLALAGLVVGLVAFVSVYFKSLWYPFIFDDAPTITGNVLVNHGDLSILFAANSRWVSMIINNLTVKLFGMNVFYFRIINLLMHGGLGILVVYTAKLLLSQLKDNEWVYPRRNLLASVVALLFLLHPVQTQTAIYISQMRLEGLVLFCTLGLILVLQQLKQSSNWLSWSGWYGLAAFICFIAAGSKEIMIVIPFLIGMTEYTFFAQGDLKKWSQTMLTYLPIFLILYGTFMMFSCPFSVKQVMSLDIALDNNRGNILTSGLDQKITSWHFLSGQFRIMVHYIKIFFIPTGLTFDYGWKLPSSWFELSVGMNLGALLLFWAYMLVRFFRDKTDIIVWATTWFFMGLLPRTSIIPTAELVCDYKTYMSSFGMMLLLAYLLVRGFEYLVTFAKGYEKQLGGICALFLIGIMSYSSEQCNQVWANDYSFWTHVVENQEHKTARVYNNYAAALHSVKQNDKALEMLHASCKADLTYAEPWINLGICASNEGSEEKAMEYFQKAVSFKHEPHKEAFANLANLYCKSGQAEKALTTVLPAIQLDPYYKVAWNVLALAYAKLGYKEGTEHAFSQMKTKSGHIDTERHLAAAYFFKNDIPNALTLLERVLTYNDSYFFNFMAGSCYYKQK